MQSNANLCSRRADTLDRERETAEPPSARPHLVTLNLTDGDRYAILVNALQDYASDARDKAQEDGITTAERDYFHAVAAAAAHLPEEIG